MTTKTDNDTHHELQRRMLPLYTASLLSGVALWVPVEKLFMSELGIRAATVGVLAAVYAGIVPLLEIPSGILADRWSRRGVLLLANVASFASVLVAALSHSVTPYVVAAVLLGVYFALQSGTIDSIVYDTVVEERGSSDGFEVVLGRVRMIESGALVASAVAGGAISALAGPRAAYVATLPFLAAAAVALLRFREPRLHEAGASSLREHVTATLTTLMRVRELRPLAALLVLTAVLTQGVFEFGPLWLVELGAPSGFFGPAWAVVIASLGIGGALGGRICVGSRRVTALTAAALVGGSVVMVGSRSAVIVTLAQVTVNAAAVAIGVVLTKLLHDRIGSEVRASISSGVGTFTWLTFLPFALVFGAVSEGSSVYTAGWIIVALSLGAAALFGYVMVSSARTVRATGRCADAGSAADPASEPLAA